MKNIKFTDTEFKQFIKYIQELQKNNGKPAPEKKPEPKKKK